MKVLTNRPLRALAALVIAGILAVGCASPTDNGGKKPGTIVIPITGLTLVQTAAPLEVGQTLALTVNMEPANASEAVVWSSSDETKATVSQAGLVTAVAVGSVTITVASPTDANIKQECAITVVPTGSLASIADKFELFNQEGVNADSTQTLPNLVNNVLTLVNTNGDSLVKAEVSKNTMVLYKTEMTGDFRLKVRVKISNRVLSSADRGVTVAAYAKTDGAFGTTPPMAGVMYRARGDIRSYYHNGSAYSAGSPQVINDTENTYDLERVIEIKRVASTGYTFSFYVPKTGDLVATADVPNASLSAAVTGNSPVYLALTAGGVTADFANIEVYDSVATDAVAVYQSGVVAASSVPLKGVSLTGPSNNPDATYEYQNAFSAMASKDLQLTATASPTYADNTSMTWASSNEAVATVSSTGLVTVKGSGTATITVTSVEGGFAATYDLNISAAANPVTSIVVGGGTSLMAGLQAYLTATLTPSDATVTTVSWSSDSPSVATIDATSGKVTAVGVGTAVLTATATDGSNVKGTLSLTVSAYSSAIWSWDSAVDSTFSLYDAAATPVYPTINGKTLVGRSSTTVLGFTQGSGVVLANNRFVIGSAYSDSAAGGATLGATTGSFNPPDGQFNFTKKAKLTIGYSTASAGTSNGITVYLNNNGTSDSATGTMLYQAADATATPALSLISSKLYESGANSATPTQAPIVTAGTPGTFSYIIDPEVFTKNAQILPKSFLQIRAASAGTITITSIKVEYID